MKRVVWAAVAATLVLVAAGVLISSALPDGLERVALTLGFASRKTVAGPDSPFADYETRYFQSRAVAQVSAGLLGVALVYGFGALLGRMVKRKR